MCPLIYAPVCGTNGQTYPNLCVLRVSRCNGANVFKAYDGKCKCVIDCPKIYKPVCGSDGKTYNNLCRLVSKNKCNGTQVRKAYNGKCRAVLRQ